MKRGLFFFVLLLFVGVQVWAQTPPTTFNAYAQDVTVAQVVDSLEAQLTDADTTEGGRQRVVDAVDIFWAPRTAYNMEDSVSMFHQYLKGFSLDRVAKQTTTPNTCTSGYMGNWKCIGPLQFPTQNQGLVNAVWADPAASGEPTTVLAAAIGGLFKGTRSGNNNWSWTCITDNSPISSGIIAPNNIAVHPTNTNHIFLGTMGGFTDHTLIPQFGANTMPPSYGAGIIFSCDGGTTWSQEIIQQGPSPDWYDEIEAVQKVYFSPDGTKLIPALCSVQNLKREAVLSLQLRTC